MSKNIKDVCFIIQARLSSERVPNKMLKPFAETTLFEIAIQKIIKSKLIPNSQFYVSIYEQELIDIARNYPVNIFHRSKQSATIDTDIKTMFEWREILPYKYVVLISACNPLLTIETINSFVDCYLFNDYSGLFSVIEKKNYF